MWPFHRWPSPPMIPVGPLAVQISTNLVAKEDKGMNFFVFQVLAAAELASAIVHNEQLASVESTRQVGISAGSTEDQMESGLLVVPTYSSLWLTSGLQSKTCCQGILKRVPLEKLQEFPCELIIASSTSTKTYQNSCSRDWCGPFIVEH